MKLFILFLCMNSMAWSANPPPSAATPKKTYTEEEFNKKLHEEVLKKVDSIKNKSVSELTKEILDKEEKLNMREVELQKQKDALRVSEGDIGKRYADLAAKQKAFIGCVEKNQEDSKTRITQLVEMVSNMKPDKAADVLSVQEADIAVQILQMIDAKKASKIFNFMTKDVSAKLQKQYLEMKK